MSEAIDVKLNYENGYYDISIGSDGDLSKVSGLDTSLIVSLFANKRASDSEVPTKQYQEGWWGNLFSDDDFEIGSKVWIALNSSIEQSTISQIRKYVDDCYQWLIDDGYADSISVSVSSRDSSIVGVVIKFSKSNIITERVYEILNNTPDV
ncbi:phage GP46 family protein [Fangia hongkongensis]|uniref:phage GP46 family protein n=1 Tax=Fangia hongkongensis TaxID=270495 RepID=UPI00038078DC|nr:phage GP46 family protein [Fangia hongkongensis]MBK2125118.1 phage GP46 family protein [Fangia hongkongensis]